MVIFKVAVESPKAARKPEPAVLPPKDEPAKKGTFISDGSFFSNQPTSLLHLLLSVFLSYRDIDFRINISSLQLYQ